MLLSFRSTVQLVSHSLPPLHFLLLLLPERQTVHLPGLQKELAQPGSASSEEARGGTRDPEHRHPYSVSVENYASVWVRWQKDVTSPWRASCSLFIAQYQWSPKVRAASVCMHAYFRCHGVLNAFPRRVKKAVPSQWLRTTCHVSVVLVKILHISGGFQIHHCAHWIFNVCFWFILGTYCHCLSSLFLFSSPMRSRDVDSSSRSSHCQLPHAVYLFHTPLKSMLIVSFSRL